MARLPLLVLKGHIPMPPTRTHTTTAVYAYASVAGTTLWAEDYSLVVKHGVPKEVVMAAGHNHLRPFSSWGLLSAWLLDVGPTLISDVRWVHGFYDERRPPEGPLGEAYRSILAPCQDPHLDPDAIIRVMLRNGESIVERASNFVFGEIEGKDEREILRWREATPMERANYAADSDWDSRHGARHPDISEDALETVEITLKERPQSERDELHAATIRKARDEFIATVAFAKESGLRVELWGMGDGQWNTDERPLEIGVAVVRTF